MKAQKWEAEREEMDFLTPEEVRHLLTARAKEDPPWLVRPDQAGDPLRKP